MKHIICIDQKSNLRLITEEELKRDSHGIVIISDLVLLIDDDMKCISVLKDRYHYCINNPSELKKNILHNPKQEDILII
jgi:hypothetical protein